MAVEQLRLICSADELLEAGRGVRFTVRRYGQELPAFVIRFAGRAFAYFNECRHVPVELDRPPGEFFDNSKLYLICSIHGALYAPDTGRCLGGRCQGKGLKSLKVHEIEGRIFLEQENNDG